MQEISVYLNKQAGAGKGSWWEKEISRRLFRSHINFRRPKDQEELVELLKRDVESNIDTVISVGGDGTAHTLIQEMVSSDIALLVVPGGTANDLASELGAQASVDKVISWVRSREMKYIDLIKINGQMMATNGGLGVGGNVAHKINDLRKRVPLFKRMMKMTGKHIYPFFAATEFLGLEFPYYNFKITSDEFNGVIRTPGLLINNQSCLGGRFEVAPGTCNSDGLFNVTAFTHKSRTSIAQCLWAMANKEKVVNDPNLISFESRKVKIELLDDTELPFFGDGEVFGHEKTWEVEMVPKSLLVYSQLGESSLLNEVNEVTLQ